MFEKRLLLYQQSKGIYHALMFGSFVAAVLLFPVTQDLVAKYVANTILQKTLPFIINYVAAIYILPEIGAMLFVKSDGNRGYDQRR